MVNTPEQAIETFLGTGIECLFLEDVWRDAPVTAGREP